MTPRLALLSIFCLTAFFTNAQQRFYKYPSFQRTVRHEIIFGQEIIDPYASLEDVKSDSTIQWIEKQKKFMLSYRNSIYSKYTTAQRALITQMDYTPFPSTKNRDFYFALHHQYKVRGPHIMYKRNYKHEFAPLCPTEVFLRDDKDKIFVRGLSVSENKRYLALQLSHSGSDWEEIRIRDIEKGVYLKDAIEWAKFGNVIWKNDGFFYSCFDAPSKENSLTSADKNQRIMYHVLGQDIKNDRVVLSSQGDFSIIYYNSVDSGKTILFYYNREMNGRKISVAAYIHTDSLDNGVKEFIQVPFDGTHFFHAFGKLDGKYLMQSFHKAPNGRVILNDPHNINAGQILITEFNQPLRFVNTLKDKIFCIYYDRGKFIPVVFDLTGKALKKLEIPDGYAVEGFETTLNDSMTSYTLSCYQNASRTMKFNLNTLESLLFDEEMGDIFSQSHTAKIVYYQSKDSVEIPMYIVHSAKLKPDSSTPLLMYAYGGFAKSTDPHHDMGFTWFMDEGGVLAVPLIRGGGELGENWHKAGMRLNKQKSFDDFIAAAEYLIDNKYTSSSHLAIQGGSNGGLLVGAAMVQRPDLFKVVVPHAAVLDLVNFHRFTSALQVGLSEYGNPNDSLEFLNLYRLSPLHHLKKDVSYPATLVIAGDHDDRVAPFHSYKFVAALQNDTKEKTYPYLLALEENEGHSINFEQTALMYAFIFENLGININRIK